MRPLIISAPAKVNLFLGVGARRADGYHDVTTVLHTLELADTVTLTPADDLTLVCDADLGIPPERNLAYRAAEEFSAAFGLQVLLDIHVAKSIPSGAGLGGGSADAAAVLAGLAHWAALPHDDPRILSVAASLGADVPFLLRGGAALMGGRGDLLSATLAPIAADVVVVKPAVSVPTGDAYRAFDADPQPAGSPEALALALAAQDLAGVATALANNMTAAAVGIVPEIADTLGWLSADAGVLGAALAGSGSAVFAICKDADAASRLATEAREKRGLWTTATRTSAGGPSVVEGASML